MMQNPMGPIKSKILYNQR